MANQKVGLNYYSVDTDRYQDQKIKRLKRQYKAMGLGVYDYVLSEIYRTKGYYLAWDADAIFDVAEYFEMQEEEVNVIILFCISIGLFNRKVWEQEMVLTSATIQKRFIEASKKAKRIITEIPEKYLIVPEECDNVREESAIVPEKIDIIPQKVKESKGKQSKGNRANALVGSDEPTADSNHELIKKYEVLTEEITGKDSVQVWESVKNFITTYHPAFIIPYVDLWNVFAHKLRLAQVQQITDSRKEKFRKRIREEPFDFITILARIKSSPMLKGETGNGWKVTFDWILENDKNYLKIIEGQYN